MHVNLKWYYNVCVAKLQWTRPGNIVVQIECATNVFVNAIVVSYVAPQCIHWQHVLAAASELLSTQCPRGLGAH